MLSSRLNILMYEFIRFRWKKLCVSRDFCLLFFKCSTIRTDTPFLRGRNGVFENTEARGRHHGVHQRFDGSDRPFHKPWMRKGSVTGHAAEITTLHAHYYYYIISTGRISNEHGVTFLFRRFKEIGRFCKYAYNDFVTTTCEN